VQAAAALKFFSWAYAKGDAMASDLDYVPMPAAVKDAIHKQWNEIKDSAGKPLVGM
jgi:phosphate transport system substrate-binding protein